MKPGAVWVSIAVLLMAGLLPPRPGQARDRELQAALQKLGCTPSKILTTALSSTLVAYEVTCKGRSETAYIVCQKSKCTPQPRRQDDNER